MANLWSRSKRPFRDTWIRCLKSDKNLQISDTTIPGLYLRYSAASGKKVFYLGYKIKGTRIHKNLLIGRYGDFELDEIRGRAIKFRQQLTDGIDPKSKIEEETKKQQKVGAKKIKVKELFPQYMEQYAKPHKKANTVISNEAHIRLYINPVLGNMYITELKLPTLINFYNDLAKKTSFSTANKVIWLILSFWNWCEKFECLPLNSNPCGKIDKKKNPKIKYEILDIDGYRKMFQALEVGPQKIFPSHQGFDADRMQIFRNHGFTENRGQIRTQSA